MTIIYTASAIFLSVAAVCGFRTWRKLGERIQPPVMRIVPEREYTSAPKPAPTIVQMSRREPMRPKGKRKVRKQERRRRVWDEHEMRGDH